MHKKSLIALFLIHAFAYASMVWAEEPKATVYTQWPFTADEAVRRQQETAEALKKKVVFTNSIGMRFKLIPSGEFIMGASQTPEEIAKIEDCPAHFFTNEHPQHRVRITKSFYMGVYEVTQDEYKRVMGRNPSDERHIDPRAPVENIDFYDIQTFIKKLGELAPAPPGYRYALPSEAQWEYACRAGAATPFYTGDTFNSFQGNFCGVSLPDDQKGPYKGTTVPVGSYQPNAWGLYDMCGNVSEWCQDWYDDSYYKISPLNDPTGPTTGTECVIRGGSWQNIAVWCRSTNRIGTKPNITGLNDGFRLALIPESFAIKAESSLGSSQDSRTFWLFVLATLLGLLGVYTLIRCKRKRAKTKPLSAESR